MIKTQDLLNLLNSPVNADKHPLEKVNILVDYIADNMEHNASDEANLNEVIFAAHKNIAETVIAEKVRLDRPLNDRTLFIGDREGNLEADNSLLSMFILSPETFAKNVAQTKLAESEAREQTEEERLIQERYRSTVDLLSGKENSYAKYTSAFSEVTNDKLNLEAKLEGNIGVGGAIKRCKAGFWEWMFRKTSPEYKVFKSALEGRMNGSTSRAKLDEAAKDYLCHKIPSYKGRGLPKLEEIEALSGKSKERAMLCYNTLLSTRESAAHETKIGQLIDAASSNVRDRETGEAYFKMRMENSVKQQNLENAPLNNDPEHQSQFQSELKNNVKENGEKNNVHNDNAVSVDSPVIEENNIIK